MTFYPLRTSALTGPYAGLGGQPSVEQDPGATAAQPPRPGVRTLSDATGRAHSGPPSAAPREDTGAETFAGITRAEIVCILLAVFGLVAVVVTTLVSTGWPL